MIVYGSRATTLKTQKIFEACPNCKTGNSVQITVFQRYAHIFWIPMFPTNRFGVSVCTNCGQALKVRQMPPELRLAYDNIKTGTRPPIWHFSGLGVIAILIFAVIISDKKQGEEVSKKVLNPKKGDIYEIKLKDDQYTLYKIINVQKDSVYFIANQFQSNEEGSSDLYAKPYDSSMTYGFPKSRLNEMLKNEKIVDITRP